MVVHHPGRAIYQPAQHLGPRVHVGDHELHLLLLRQRHAVFLGQPDVVDYVLQRFLCPAQRRRAHGDATQIQGLHEGHEAQALLAYHVGRRHLDLVEDNLGGGRGANAQLLLDHADLGAHLFFDYEGGHAAARAEGRIGHGQHREEVGEGAVADVDLVAGDDPVAVGAHGARLDGCGIRARACLGQAEGADLGALRQWSQVFLLQRMRAVHVQRHGGDADVCADDRCHRAVHPANLLHQDHIAELTCAAAAVFLGKGDAEQSGLARDLDRVEGHLGFFVGLLRHRPELVLHHVPDHLAQQVILFG